MTYYLGWLEGREDFAETLISYMHYLAEYHNEVEPLIKDLIHTIEEEVGKEPEEEGDD